MCNRCRRDLGVKFAARRCIKRAGRFAKGARKMDNGQWSMDNECIAKGDDFKQSAKPTPQLSIVSCQLSIKDCNVRENND